MQFPGRRLTESPRGKGQSTPLYGPASRIDGRNSELLPGCRDKEQELVQGVRPQGESTILRFD